MCVKFNNNERKIEELNEDIESLKEANDNYKKQLNEKNDVINKINDEQFHNFLTTL